MPSSEVKQILTKWKIDTSDWRKALTEVLQKTAELRKSEEAQQSKNKTYLDWQLKQIRLSIGDVRAEVSERAKVSQQLLNQINQQKLVTAAAQATTAQHRATLAQIQAQTAALRQQQMTQRGLPAGGGGGGRGGGGGQGGGFLGGFAGGFASRLAGTIGFAVLSAEGLGRVFEQLYEKTKRFIEESGPLEQVRQQFEKLSQIKGIDSIKFLQDMRNATHNLVADVELYRTANKFMQSGIVASEEQIVKLTASVIGLARAQGRDATQALNALNQGLATGRFQRLAYITGITREELSVRGLSATMSAHQRIQAQFEQAQNAINKRFAQFGEPALTFTETLKQMSVVTTRLFESFSRGVVQSRGMHEMFDYLNTVIEKLTSREGGVEALGQKFGDAFIALAEVFKTVETVVEALLKTIKGVVQYGSEVVRFFAPSTIGDDFLSRLTTFSGLMKTAAQAAVMVKYSLKEVGSQLLYEAGGFIPNFGKGKRLTPAEHKAEVEKQREEELEAYIKLEKKFSEPQKKTDLTSGGGGAGGANDEASIALQRAIAQEKLKLAKDTAKGILDLDKLMLDQEKNLNEEAYQDGTRSFADYMARKKSLRELELIDTLKNIRADREAQAAEFRSKLSSKQIDPSQYALMMKDLNVTTTDKSNLAYKQAQQDQAVLDRKIAKDKRDAATIDAETPLKVRQKQLQDEEKVVDDQLKNIEISVKDASQRKIDIWLEEFAIFKKLEEDKVKGAVDSAVAQANMDQAIALKKREIDDKIKRQEDNTADEELARKQRVFDKEIKMYEAQRNVARAQGGKKGTGDGEATQALIDKYTARLHEMVADLNNTPVGSEKWLELADSIGMVSTRLVNLSNQMPSLAGSIGNLFSAIGSGFSALGARQSVTHYDPITKTQGLTTVPLATQIAGAASNVGGYVAGQVEYQKYAKTNSIDSNPFSAMGSTIKALAKGSGDAAKNLEKFSEELKASFESIGQVTAALSGQGGPLQAGVSGAVGGAGLGAAAGKGIAAIGSLMGKSLGAAGPIGEAAGAAIGLVTGIFSGKARKAAEAIAKTITDGINKTMKEFALQNATLQQTIIALQQERQSAIDQLSSKKGGRDQLDKILPQLDQQIAQLQQQQKQIMVQMDQNLQIIGSPAPWQPLLQNIQGIIKSYKEYIGAGGDVTKANAFLKDSFANLQITNMTTLNTDMQDAINNALQYNDLLLQRQQYIAQTDQQIQDIMAAGAPARMRTTAQTKMAQIEQIELQRTRQLEQMNEQITVAGYRLTAESKIFSLAQDRVGLEMQLAKLQMATIDQDVARINALKELITLMGGGSITAAIAAALAANPTSGTAGLGALLTALGLSSTGGVASSQGPVGPSSGTLEDHLGRTYSNRARQGYADFYGEQR